ncbi:hypothetical protein [Engelhardtia mirabilis]|uniref:Uncharacterized protein n=1 Tax=Engelhardtia mirabilis TaxID=2528011 RepID=A0A518BEC3_9BACT|nr:hypothetical protein Pla133_03960 [Planctomycetes bacterium Pla133]QDU99657.1 hypothetical protein Pla86_03960 [Planctomycetes bacterium Pla86]
MRTTALIVALGLGLAACRTEAPPSTPSLEVAAGEVTAGLVLDKVP